MKQFSKFLEILLVAIVILSVFTVAIMFMGCKPDPEIPVPEDEYVEVSLSSGLAYIIEPSAMRFVDEPVVIQGIESASRVKDVNVDWNHEDFVDWNTPVEVWFNAGAGSAGETVSYESTYGDLKTDKFRVRRGTYAQIHIFPRDIEINPSVPTKSQNLVFSAVKDNVDITQPGNILLSVNTNFHVMLVPTVEATPVGTSWDITAIIDGVTTPSKYFYHTGLPGYTFDVIAADDGSIIPINVVNVVPGSIMVLYVGIGVGFDYDFSNL
jgi:hypothetical protein